jgi:hypothetical protein
MWLLVIPLVSFGHCIECPSLIYGFTVNTMAKRYQRHNQKLYIKGGQSIQWSNDTKGITRSGISKKDSQYNGQKIPKA